MLDSETERTKNLGAFCTPREIAYFLAEWAIRKPSDRVLDPGAGTGIFVEAALERLAALGKQPADALSQIYAVELDKRRYHQLLLNVAEKFGLEKWDNAIQSDFFDVKPAVSAFAKGLKLVEMDAAIGNPPYIERQRLRNVSTTQRKVVGALEHDVRLHRVTDIYGYFILHATSFLKEGGRLAFIVSDTWLSMDFGKSLKGFLLASFEPKAIVGFDKRVFSNALVRAVLLLVERRKRPNPENSVTFIQLRSHEAVGKLHSVLTGGSEGNGWAKVVKVGQTFLDPNESWSKYLKGSKVYFKVAENSRVTKLGEIATVNIGVQTLRKDFYVFDRERAVRSGIESAFLEPILFSPREAPYIVRTKTEASGHLLYCDLPKDKLRGTRLLEYIELAEKRKITPRGKPTAVRGVHNLPRIKKAGRNPWYNLKPEVERRCRGSVLVPRRFYRKFYVTWNKAGVVANEDFINVYPKDSSSVQALLAVLNSSVTELVCRVQGQLYGGGVLDLRPDDVRSLLALDLRVLSVQDKQRLEEAYQKFVETSNRDAIDTVTTELLGLSEEDIARLSNELNDLRALSETSKG